MFDYEINAYLASLGRRLATYEDLADAEAAIQAMIEGYYGLNETAEARATTTTARPRTTTASNILR